MIENELRGYHLRHYHEILCFIVTHTFTQQPEISIVQLNRLIISAWKNIDYELSSLITEHVVCLFVVFLSLCDFFNTLSIYWPVENLLSNFRTEFSLITHAQKGFFCFSQTPRPSFLLNLNYTASAPESLVFDLHVFFLLIAIILVY